MKLRELAQSATGLIGIRGDADCEIAYLCADSRRKDLLPGSLFFCVSGANFDGHRFAAQATAGGAAALVVERLLPELDIPQMQVQSVRKTMGPVADAFHDHPARKMCMLAITGTKGKTTTSYLVKSILEQQGLKCGLIGTIGNMIGQRVMKTALTTPEAVDLHAVLAEMVEEGVQACVMEASAHALDMYRLEGIVFDGVAYTNLLHDHLDYFHTMDNYAAAKQKLFTPHYARNCVYNADDEMTSFMQADNGLPFVTYGIRSQSDISARDIEISEMGVSFMLRLRDAAEVPISLHLTGMFNVYNAMCAAGLCMIAGASMQAIRKGLETIKVVPGRAEMLDTHTPYRVVLDYSHVPAALEDILNVVRTFTRNRLIALFGCGGDRDREKRPVMGEIGGRLADFSILTSDNARNEDPFDILEMIEEGIKPTGGSYCVIENRRDAIRYALEMAQEGDIIVLAGKGHETYQEVRGVKQPFDEKVVVAELLAEMREKEKNRSDA